MYCYHCGALLSEYDYCTNCGADVGTYKKIIALSNRLYNDGLEKAKVRDLTGAGGSLRQCLKLNKDHIEARNLLGLVYFEMGETAAALSEWVVSQSRRGEKNIAIEYINLFQNNAGKVDVINQSIRKYNQAYQYCLQDSVDLAEIQLKKLLSMNPKLIRAHLLLALIFIRDEKWERAERELHKILEVDHNNTMALRYLKEVERVLEPEEGEKKPRHKGKDEVIRYQTGNELIIQPTNTLEQKAGSGFSTVINILIGLILGVAATYFLILPAKVSSVTEEYTAKMVELGETMDTKTSAIQELETQVNNLKTQNAGLEEIIDEYSGQGGILSNIDLLLTAADAYLNGATADETADALTTASSAVELEAMSEPFRSLYKTLMGKVGPELSTNFYTEGYTAYRNEDYESAVRLLTQAFEYDATNVDALFNLGNAYRKLGDNDSAKEIYEQVISQFPNDERATRSRQFLDEMAAED
ncbi:MAG: tetratricopeptide repeat protein [Lachnospiraceae bacterium]|nr:tetratricopeptide repeat protein [Lachnospiraceae bacterium]